jgi:hypothetical protein
MNLIRRSPDQIAGKESRQREELVTQKRAEFEYTWRGFWESPPGVARRAFKNGDHVFQYSLDVLDQAAIMTAMVGSSTRIVRLDPSAVLDAVCREGWELVDGSFAVARAEDGFSTGDKLLGHYLLRRCEENREPETEEELARRLGWSPTVPDQTDNDALSCPECGATFAGLEDYADHYHSKHQNASIV